MKGDGVNVANISILAVTKLGVLCGSFYIRGWIEILNLLIASQCTRKLRFC